MRNQKTGLFLARMREKFFKRRLSVEIHDRISPHVRGERNFGYPFDTRAEMNAEAEALNVLPLLEKIEEHIRNMPKAYAESFRYILHRDLHETVRRYEREARLAIQPKDPDPRFVATRYEPLSLQPS